MKIISKLEFNTKDNDNIMNEIEILKKIDHPNIMKIIEYYTS